VYRFYYWAVFLTSICVLSAQTTTKSIEWKKIKPEILERYRALLQIDTTAGHETRAVDYLKRVIEAEGISIQTFALDPQRANLVARIKGNGSKRPLLIFAHTDVVGVQRREKWQLIRSALS
jgi:acetylornithine deacetylase/succinyl-diaminopimelate desuccinylase-like protein